MSCSMRLTLVALIPAVLWFANPTVAGDLDARMQEFRVSPTGLKPAPAFTLWTLEGNPAALTDHRGRCVLLYFWDAW